VKTYTFDDLVKTLNGLAPFDWAGFFHARLTSTSAEAPVGGIENSGWKVVFNDKPLKLEGRRGDPGDVYSIGLHVGRDGVVTDAIVGSPAFEAGVSSQMKIVGVNGRVYTPELLSDAIKSAKDTRNRSHSSSSWTIIFEHVLLLTMTAHVTRTWCVMESGRTISTS
jgi:predicted metalloprotease with PDZ domain